MSYTIIQNSSITSTLSNRAFRFYCYLQSVSFGNRTESFKSQETMSKELHCSIRTISRAVQELVKNGLISVRRRGSTSNVYVLLKKQANQVANNVSNKINNIKKNIKKGSTNKRTPYTKNQSTKKGNWDTYQNKRSSDYYLQFENQLLGWE